MEKCWITQKLLIFVKLNETNYPCAKFSRKSPRNIIVFVYCFIIPAYCNKRNESSFSTHPIKNKKAINEQTATPCHLIYREALINIISEHLKLPKDGCGEEQALRNESPS